MIQQSMFSVVVTSAHALVVLVVVVVAVPIHSLAEVKREARTPKRQRELRDFAILIYQSYEARVYTAFNLRRRHVFLFQKSSLSLSRTRTKRELTKKETARRGRIH